MKRLPYLVILGLLSFTLSCDEPWESDLVNINPRYMMTPQEAYALHLNKDNNGPTYSGNPAWHKYMKLNEKLLKACGVADITKNAWRYDLWHTSEWPDNSGWSLVSDGRSVEVASYGAYSGSTGASGITAQMVYYNPFAPPSPAEMAGKIVLFKTLPHPAPPYSLQYMLFFTQGDYEYLTDPESFTPMLQPIPVQESIAADIWYQLMQVSTFIEVLKSSGAAGGVFVFDAAYDRMAGLYTFPVPQPYSSPCLYLDRVEGEQVIEDARMGKTATLRLQGRVETVETYQLIGYLPGAKYGTPEDEKILLISHTDGPSISQDNGAFGILGLVHYFSNFPKAMRPRTLMIYLDNRHYMPGMEPAFAQNDWLNRHPEHVGDIVSVIGIEHLGQMQYREVGEVFEPTGRVESSFLWTRNNQNLIDMAIDAVMDNSWPRVQVQCPERPGIHGGPQGFWYGMGQMATALNLPGYGTMGGQGAYWSTTAGIDQFDADLFYSQVAAMAQLTGQLMIADLDDIEPVVH